MPSIRASLRAFPRAFWVLVGATFVTRFGVFVLPFLTLFMTRKGFSPAEAGLATGAYSLGSFFAAALGGWLADRIGRNVTMAFSALAGAACMLVFSQAESFLWIVVLSALTGFVQESGNPAINALVQDIVPVEHRVNAYAINRFTINLAWSLGPAAAGLLAERSFLWLFVGDAATSAIFGVIALLCLPKGRPTPKATAGWSHALRSIFANRPFLALAAAQVFMAFNFRQLGTAYPLHFDRTGMPLDWLGLVQALNGLMIVLLEIALLSMTRHWPVRFALGLGYIIFGVCFLLFFGGASLTIFIAVMAIFTIGEMLAFSRQQAYSASLSHDDMRGRYSGFLGLAWCIGSSSGAAVGMWVYEWNPQSLWLICAAFGVLAAICLAFSKPKNGVVKEPA